MKDLIYHKDTSPELDAAFQRADRYAKVRLTPTHLFWKKGLRWYTVPLANVTRAYRRVEAVTSKTCCASADFDIQKLMLTLTDGTQLELLIGDSLFHHEAERLFEAMKTQAPHVDFSKPAL